MVTDISRLTESPGPMQIKNGAKYHDGEQIISHLNYSLGPDGWDWEELERGYDEMADQVWVRGRLTARFVAEGPNGDVTTQASKVECGWNEVKRKREDRTKLIDLGSDYKGADTDALKRAARLLGVGLDAWEKGGAAPRRQVCDAKKWNARWHAVANGTRFADDEVRHKFLSWYSDGAFTSLSEWLKDATDEEVQTLIATLEDRIAAEARRDVVRPQAAS